LGVVVAGTDVLMRTGLLLYDRHQWRVFAALPVVAVSCEIFRSAMVVTKLPVVKCITAANYARSLDCLRLLPLDLGHVQNPNGIGRKEGGEW